MVRFRFKAGLVRAVGLLMAVIVAAQGQVCAASNEDKRPYDKRLLRLSEILGAVHYLRELCGAQDGQRWREAIGELIKSEGTSALRRATIARSFNLGYRSYRRTYRNCTPSARNTIKRFFKEGVEISEELAKLGNPGS